MRIAGFNELRVRLEQSHVLTVASIDLTRRCNLRCIHCLRALDNAEGLPLPDIRSVIDQLVELGCLLLTLTGGEPFARHDVMEIVRYAWHKRLPVKIITNGTLITAETASELKRCHVTEVQFSLYAAAPAVHDAITRHNGSHERTLRAIALTKACGLNATVATPVLAVNAEQIPALQQLCDGMGVTLTRGLLIFPRNDGDGQPLNLAATFAQLSALATEHGHDNAAAPVQPDECAVMQTLCSAGRDRLAISSDGTIYPCDAFHIPLGHVQTDRLADIWLRSETLARLRSLRKEFPPACDGCSARPQCVWCPGLSLDVIGDPAAPSAQDCRRTRLAYARKGGDEPGWSAPQSLAWPQATTNSTKCGNTASRFLSPNGNRGVGGYLG